MKVGKTSVGPIMMLLFLLIYSRIVSVIASYIKGGKYQLTFVFQKVNTNVLITIIYVSIADVIVIKLYNSHLNELCFMNSEWLRFSTRVVKMLSYKRHAINSKAD